MTVTLNFLAAGSLKRAFTPLLAAFSEQYGVAVEASFGPAGLLRERIEAGEPCARLLFPATEHTHHIVGGIELHQQVQGLVL
ncbi:hypothetical protein ACUY4R_003798 [Kosakonia sp. BK9b]|uniref:substrate-binding domain-containing protein n=1 Tax=Kosakonia sp. TaxID=1916651 RepID=UPI00390C7088